MRLRVVYGLALLPIVALSCTSLTGLTDTGSSADGGPSVDDGGPEAAPTTSDSGADGDSRLADAGDDGGGGGGLLDASSGDANADAAGGKCGVHPGPQMVDVGTYCIDATEVSLAQYNQFLATNPPVTSYQPQTPDCDFNVSYAANVFRVGKDLPVHVNWCSAYAFCAWAGKRLCGKISGGALLSTEAADPAASQWMRVCSQVGATKYPYGQVYSSSTCRTYDTPDGGYKSANVGTTQDCHGTTAPYDAVFDMSGNVEEWEDNCAGSICATRGGSAELNGTYSVCSDLGASRYRNTNIGEIGFRCCSK